MTRTRADLLQEYRETMKLAYQALAAYGENSPYVHKLDEEASILAWALGV